MFDGSEGRVAHPETHEAIFTRLALCGSAIGHPTVMMRSSTLSDNKIAYPEHLSPAEDYAFWCDIASYGKFYNIPEVLLRYRVHGQNVSVTRKKMQDEAVDVTRRVMIARVGNLDIENDSKKVELLFEFLYDGERDQGYSDREISVIDSFLSSLANNRSIDRDELQSVLGKRRLFVYESASAHPLFYKIYTTLRRLKIRYS
jgi:hypothetical protein